MGSLTAGGAAALGTGATESFQTERSLSVAVTGDANAYLGLDADSDSVFVNNSSPLSIDFSGNSGYGGSGVSDNGTSESRPGFELSNQHEETLYVEANNPAADSDITDGGVDVQLIACPDADGFVGTNGNKAVLFDRQNTVQKVSPNGSSVDPASIPQKTGGSVVRGIIGSKRGPSATQDDPRYLELESGESVDVIVRVIAHDAGDVTIDGTLEIEAFTEESDTTLSTSYNPEFSGQEE